MPHLKQATDIVEPAYCKICLQQSEHHEINLRTAAADAFALAEHRLDRIDGHQIVAPVKCRKCACEDRNGRACRILPGARSLRLECHFKSGHWNSARCDANGRK
jgi:predicted Zn-ribbon and HTH transcriptional regulator